MALMSILLRVSEDRALDLLVQSNKFEMFVGIAILCNSVFIGVQVEYFAHNVGSPEPVAFVVLGYFFWIFFLTELTLRICARGSIDYFCGPMRAWNILDFILLICSTLDACVQIVNASSKSTDADVLKFNVIRLVRIIRIVRSIRLVRIMRVFRQLRLMVASILGTLKSAIWALSLLCIIIYVFGTLFTDGVTERLQNGTVHVMEIELLQETFGTLPRATFALFKSICGGESWGNLVAPLSELHWMYVFLFNAYIAFTYFAVLNVMTGVFCQSAIETAEKDADIVISELIHEKGKITCKLKEVFRNTLDDFNSGNLTLAEFEGHLTDDRLQAFFISIGIAVDDGWTLFKLLDSQKKGAVNINEFVNGCLHLRGSATKIDFEKIMYGQHHICGRLEVIDAAIARLGERGGAGAASAPSNSSSLNFARRPCFRSTLASVASSRDASEVCDDAPL